MCVKIKYILLTYSRISIYKHWTKQIDISNEGVINCCDYSVQDDTVEYFSFLI